MADRQRLRVGRRGFYFPTDGEASTGNGNAGDAWDAVITAVTAAGAVNLKVHEADGGIIAKTAVLVGESKGSFSLLAPSGG